MAVIYQITNMLNGKYYIGSSNSFVKRVWQHKYDLKNGIHKNPKLQAAWNKYGADAFVFEIIEEVPEGENQLVVEDRYLSVCVGKPECYNINTGAEATRLGIPHTEETKNKMSERVQQAIAEGRGGKFIPSAETRAKMSASLKGNQCAKGYKRTPEEIEKIRARTKGNKQWLGKHHSKETIAKVSRAVIATKPDGTKVEFVGLNTLKNETGATMVTIIRACKTGAVIKTGALAGCVLSYKDAEKLNEQPDVPDEYADLPRTRYEAKKIGAKTYFTGEPCSRGHLSPRKTKGSCITCDREDDKAKRERDAGKPKSEASIAAAKRYYEKNRERLIAAATQRNREKRAERGA